MPYDARKMEEKTGFVYQSVLAHATGVAKLCEVSVKKFSDAKIGELLGYLHDIGKYSEMFQRRIHGENILVGHARAGAHECERLYRASKGRNVVYRLMGMAICGHHSGLMDFGDDAQVGSYYTKITNTADVEAYDAWLSEIPALTSLVSQNWNMKCRTPIDKTEDNKRKSAGFMLQLYGRFLFSCLVDADRTDAQNFPRGEADRLMHGRASITELKMMFDDQMDAFAENAEKTELNQIRNEILSDCLKAAEVEKGFFSLTVPTGGGKTRSSMAFALHHAARYGQERVIYAIPFTSIIEQNADVFAGIFGRENILEHHSNFESPGKKEGEYATEEELKLKLAKENWHEPIIVTTNVQFFESLFSHKPSKVRKLHHIANSVIILDEVQSIPNQYVRPCMEALHELVENYGCTVVLCSATQPEFEKNKLFLAKTVVREIIGQVEPLFSILRRTTEVYLGTQTIDEIAAKMRTEAQALCIVNTKKHARDLFQLLKEEENVFHLSTNMYPRHRKEILQKVKAFLKQELPCKVISTQLIEAGVDIDFPTVYRSTTGIDSIVQAAGRCNREGKRPTGMVYVFQPEEKYIGKGYLALTAELGRMIATGHENFLHLDAVSQYFHRLFDMTKQNLDQGEIMRTCANAVTKTDNLRIPYEEISRNFKFIENQGYSIVIEADAEVSANLQAAKYAKSLSAILKKLSPYTVNVKGYELIKLQEQGAVNQITEGVYVLANKSLYDQAYGLVLSSTDDEDYIV